MRTQLQLLTADDEDEDDSRQQRRHKADCMELVNTAAVDSRFKLPDGWVVEEKRRNSGYTNGRTDRYYYEPKTGQKFRSLRAVEKYLGDLKEENSQEALKSHNKPKHSQKSGSEKENTTSDMAKTLAFNFTNPPEKISWVLTAPRRDKWCPFMDELMVPNSEKQLWTEIFVASMNDKNFNAPSSQVNDSGSYHERNSEKQVGEDDSSEFMVRPNLG